MSVFDKEELAASELKKGWEGYVDTAGNFYPVRPRNQMFWKNVYSISERYAEDYLKEHNIIYTDATKTAKEYLICVLNWCSFEYYMAYQYAFVNKKYTNAYITDKQRATMRKLFEINDDDMAIYNYYMEGIPTNLAVIFPKNEIISGAKAVSTNIIKSTDTETIITKAEDLTNETNDLLKKMSDVELFSWGITHKLNSTDTKTDTTPNVWIDTGTGIETGSSVNSLTNIKIDKGYNNEFSNNILSQREIERLLGGPTAENNKFHSGPHNRIII